MEVDFNDGIDDMDEIDDTNGVTILMKQYQGWKFPMWVESIIQNAIPIWKYTT